MDSLSNTQMILWLRNKMNECENEIRYLEELLVTLSGPADDVINSLELNKRMYNELASSYNGRIKIEEENRNAN
jgi:hypothetical protein